MKAVTKLEDWHLRSIFVWLPEIAFERYIPAGVPNCPRCKTAERVIKKGWISNKFRRGIMRHRCAELTTYFYQCSQCRDDKVTTEVRDENV